MRRYDEGLGRREFLRRAMHAGVAAASTAAVFGAVPGERQADQADPVRTTLFGKTGIRLPVLGYGGAALPRVWMNPLSTEDRIKLVRTACDRGLRYFDTAGNYLESQSILGEGLKGVRDRVFLVTKVETTDPERVRPAVEKSLKELQTDRLEAVLIHGTPGLENMTVEQAMKVHGALVKLRDEKMLRFVGLSAHSYYEKALAAISTGGFDLCMLSYGYFTRGYNQIASPRMVALRDACLAKAHELGMGIVAMKVVAAGMLGAWSGHVVPGFDKARLAQLPAAAVRYALDEKRIHILAIGMRLEQEIDANVRTISGDTSYTDEDRALLKEFTAKALESDAVKKLKVE